MAQLELRLLPIRDNPTSPDEFLVRPVAVCPHPAGEVNQFVRVRVGGRLLAGLHGSSLLPVLVAFDSPAEMSRAVGIHVSRLKGSGGDSPPSR